MARSVVLKGAEVKLFIGGKLYREVQGIQFTIDYGEYEIYGIDSQYAQEIAPTKVMVNGSVSGIKVKGVGGLQGYGVRPKISDVLVGPYVSIRLQDRTSKKDFLWLPQAKISSETINVKAKDVVTISFKFKGIIPYGEIDTA